MTEDDGLSEKRWMSEQLSYMGNTSEKLEQLIEEMEQGRGT